MLATEPVPELENKLEVHANNELMRHIPSMGWMAEKLDGDVRRRIEKICAGVESRMNGDVDNELRSLSRALDRLADVAKYIRSNGHGPNEPIHKVRWSLNHALSCLRLIDASTFGRRAPFHQFEKSKSECVYAAFLVVLDHLGRLTRAAGAVDPDLNEHLCEGVVQLAEPLRVQPIA